MRDPTPFLSERIADLYRPFEVRRFKQPSIAWLNDRHWRQAGVIDSPEAALALERNLIDWFGAAAPSRHDPSEIFQDGSHTLYADRYGAPLGAIHGGSGRGGVLGDLSAKGVGATPLCSPDADWYHSHGCVWLEEAIREAIYSELAWLEFPHGANPVVAIIDTGEAIYWPDGTTGDRRAIIVRTASSRLAHLERSIYFGTSGESGSDQVVDADRVSQTVKCIEDHPEHVTLEGGDLKVRIEGMFERVATQIGFGHFHRLTHGDYYSSNVTLSGALVDFGSFRSLPDWSRSFCVADAPGFGEEQNNVLPTIKAVCFYLQKYARVAPSINTGSLSTRFIQRVRQTFQGELEALVEPGSGSDEADAVVMILQQEFKRQQFRGRNYLEGGSDRANGGWLYHGLINGPRGRRDPLAYEVGAALRQTLTGSERTPHLQAMAGRLVRWATPRPLLGRERLQSLIYRMIRRLNLEHGQGTDLKGRAIISGFIDDIISKSRRVFPLNGATEIVEGHVSSMTSRLLICYETTSDAPYLRLEGLVRDGTVRVFGQDIAIDDIASFAPQCGDQGFQAWRLDRGALAPDGELRIADKLINLKPVSTYAKLL
ncbi:protein adenylyltransferase SelO family protein [uncultured Brevundimonas sp.]|uniref:protein adenylyltransferase SelO family protein n=1 Tax=uncultured Brevundimonas sp. TaxID=213418 RepID=UPI0025E925DE|nr:protein adenylyltransferase SelO family protein [uncultured Brevundimonas sp.]